MYNLKQFVMNRPKIDENNSKFFLEIKNFT